MKKALMLLLVLTLILPLTPAQAAIKSTAKPCVYQAFMDEMMDYDKQMKEIVEVYDPLISGGYWTRFVSILDMSMEMLIRTDSIKSSGKIQEVSLFANRENADVLFAFSVIAMDCLVNLRNNHMTKCSKLAAVLKKNAEAADSLFAEESAAFLSQDGYQWTMGRDPDDPDLFWTRIQWEAALESDILVPSPEARVSIENGPALDVFLDRVRANCAALLKFSMFTLPEYEEKDGLHTYSVEWDDCFFILVTDAEEKVVNYAMVCESGRIASLWLHNYALLLAVTGAEDKDTTPLIALQGRSINWDYLTALKPYAVYHDIVMYCLNDEASGLPMIYVGGWQPDGQ